MTFGRGIRVVVVIAIILVGVELLGPAQAPPDPEFEMTFGNFGTGEGQLNGPEGIASSENGDIYVANTLNHRVDVFNSEGEFVRSWGGFCSLEDLASCNDPAGNGQFNEPEGIVVNSEEGLVYVADSGNDRIQVFDLEGNFVRAIGSSGNEEGELRIPLGLDLDDDGNLFVADLLNHRISAFEPDGTFIRAFGERGSEAGQLFLPVDVVIGNGLIYVVENANDRIQSFTLQGESTNLWGSECDLSTGDGCDNPNGEGQFRSPFAISSDAEGNIYVLDQGNHRVQIFTSDGTYLNQFGSVCALFGSDDIPAGTGCQNESGEGQFLFPKGIEVAATGEILISDSDNHRIQIFE